MSSKKITKPTKKQNPIEEEERQKRDRVLDSLYSYYLCCFIKNWTRRTYTVCILHKHPRKK